MAYGVMRRVCAFVAGLFLIFAAVPVASAQTPVVAGDEGGLKVMTYNTHHGSGNDDCEDPETAEGEIPPADCALNLERIAGIIEEQAPDVVALQEVDRFWARSGGVDQPEELASMLDMESCYGANLDHEADDHADVPHQYGVAILSVYPITSCENTLLPTFEGLEQRGLLDARVDVPGVGEVAILDTHLDHKEKENRTNQAEAVAAYIAELDVPVVLMGDLNAEAEDGDLDSLTGSLTDAWATAGEGDGYTYPADPDEPAEKRIDFILVSEQFAVTDVEVVENDDTRMSADHYPVVAELSLGGAATPAGTPSASPVVN